MYLTPLQNSTRLRETHDTTRQYLALINIGARIYGGEVWTCPETTAYNKIGDQWMRVEAIDDKPFSGWVAITHNGVQICKEITTAPPSSAKPVSMTLYFEDGTKKEYAVS